MKGFNDSIKDIGPTPGALDIAAARKKLKPMMKRMFSFNKCGLKNNLRINANKN